MNSVVSSASQVDILSGEGLRVTPGSLFDAQPLLDMSIGLLGKYSLDLDFLYERKAFFVLLKS